MTCTTRMASPRATARDPGELRQVCSLNCCKPWEAKAGERKGTGQLHKCLGSLLRFSGEWQAYPRHHQ